MQFTQDSANVSIVSKKLVLVDDHLSLGTIYE